MEGSDGNPTNPFLTNSTNPFDDDVDDEAFLRPSTSRFVVSEKPKNPFYNDIAQEDVDLGGQKELAQSRTLASTERSLALLAESELIGEGVANELSQQKEQLENCHRKVDDINANLRNSQKYLRRIKSFFAGFKDFMMGVQIKPVRKNESMEKSESSEESMNRQHAFGHRSRSVTVKETASSHPGMTIRPAGDDTRPRNLQFRIDQNLDQMLNHVVGLKGLAVDLGEELEQQSELIDALNDKTEEAQISLGKQNKDIAKLLK